MTLEEMKSYLRVDGTDSDADIIAFMTAATLYINQQTGKTKKVTGRNADGTLTLTDIDTDELYNLCVKIMVAHWYENRGVEIPGQLTRIAHSVDAIINHIAMCGDYV